MIDFLMHRQPELVPILPTIEGNVDYITLQNQLIRIDELLRLSGLETQWVRDCTRLWLENWQDLSAVSFKMLRKYQERSAQALRCNLLRALLQEDYRRFSIHLAESPLLQWFVGLNRLDIVRVPSKSTLQRYSDWAAQPTVQAQLNRLLQAALQGQSVLELEKDLELDTILFDSTCLKTAIHFPVDWVLLRDGVQTLIRAMILIRKHGLRHRMPTPESFLRNMNQLCIQMSQVSRRYPEGKRGRKKVLREMKRFVRTVRSHAQRYRELLDRNYAQTDWTRPQAEQVLRRMDSVLALLPRAQKQAHERIIGERPVPNRDKILSLYETDTRVIVRGKAGAEVEFGNKLFLSESPDGLIVDFHLAREGAPSDAPELLDSVIRIEQALPVEIGRVVTDRGCDSADSRAFMDALNIENGICPKSPRRLKERLREVEFVRWQRRRAQTEGRIGILKNQFLGRPLRAKGFEHRELAVSWAVLAHNLWVLARMPKAEAVEQAA